MSERKLFGTSHGQDKKNNKGSFASTNSFLSFGSMDIDEEVVIINPVDIVSGSSPSNPIDKSPISESQIKEKNEQREKQIIHNIVSKEIAVGYRDQKQKERIDKLKEKGMYVSSDERNIYKTYGHRASGRSSLFRKLNPFSRFTTKRVRPSKVQRSAQESIVPEVQESLLGRNNAQSNYIVQEEEKVNEEAP